MIRCRFAPSPTGNLHVGGVRTALFNWLFAKNNNGKFILRIEDTDTERSTKEYEDQIIKSMKWCGLDWDEGPDIKGPYSYYRQSERYREGIYDKIINELIEKKHAYYALYKREDPKTIIKTSFDKFENFDNSFSTTVKFKIPQSETTEFFDLLKGEMRFKNELFEDFVIRKSNGFPTYNFAVVVDDYLMKISHVFRGEDHLTNTPKQVMIYEALGWELPKFMHIPLILGKDKAPLSKRHGHTSVENFIREGYLSDALMNFLALLGWNVKEDIFFIKDKIKNFNIESISNKGVVFDYEKLEWVNGKHLRMLSVEQAVEEYLKWLVLTDKNDLKEKIEKNLEYSKNVIRICREKINTLAQLYDFSSPFFDDDFSYDDKYKEKFLNMDWNLPLLEKAIEMFNRSNDWSDEGCEEIIRNLTTEKITSKKKTFQFLRGAISGRLITPGLFETYSVLGKEKVMQRFQRLKKEIE